MYFLEREREREYGSSVSKNCNKAWIRHLYHLREREKERENDEVFCQPIYKCQYNME